MDVEDLNPGHSAVSLRVVTRRPRILVFNEYYWPGLEATAHLLDELCTALARDFDITVVTGMLRDSDASPGRSHRGDVEVIRVRSTAYDRSRLVLRAANYVTYVLNALRAGLGAERPDVVMTMSDPPFVGNVGQLVARRFRVPFVVISQDVFPEIAVELERLQNPVLLAILRRMIRFYLRRADRVVAIGEAMRRRLEAKGVDAGRLCVIPNWVDTDAISPQPHDNEWSRANDLDGRFVVMHSGNVGHAQDLDSLIHAVTFLRDLDRLVVAIIGSGARYAELVALAEQLETDAVRFLPYQPRETLSLSLSAGDVHFVGLARGLAGYVVPSRIYGVLAAGRPVIASADDDSETAETVRSARCGVVVPPGRPDLLAAAIRDAHDGRYDFEEMGTRGREWVEREASRERAVTRYRALLAELSQAGRSRSS
jgi:colanic acid biosynthesis glycosyl transferase WcaI